MGTWDSGPFDNDAASDWASDLQDASPENRAAVVRSALTLEEGYLDVDDGQAAVAAVAVVAVISARMHRLGWWDSGEMKRGWLLTWEDVLAKRHRSQFEEPPARCDCPMLRRRSMWCLMTRI